MKKKRVFISYRFTGEDVGELKDFMHQVHDAVAVSGNDHYSTIFDTDQFAEKRWSGKAIMEKAFMEIDASDAVLFLVRSPIPSEGMLVELGYSLAKGKRLYLAIQEDIKESIFRRQIANIIEFKDLSDLKGKLVSLKL